MKKIVMITFVLTLLALSTGCSNENDKVYTMVNGEKVEKRMYELNEKVYCYNTEFTVTNIQEKTHKQDSGITKGNKLVAVTYKIKNTGDSEKTFSASDFTVISKDGEVIDSKLAVFTNMWKGDFLKSPTLANNGSKEGYLVYELKENDNDYTIQYYCTITLTFDKIYINVKNK